LGALQQTPQGSGAVVGVAGMAALPRLRGWPLHLLLPSSSAGESSPSVDHGVFHHD
jgi:hypothetical protein